MLIDKESRNCTMARRSHRSDSTDFAVCVKPLDEIQLDNEEICVPIMVELRRQGPRYQPKKCQEWHVMI